MEPTQAQIKALGRASRRAAVLTMVGATIVFGALAYSAWRLTRLKTEESALRAKVEAHRNEDKELLAELEALKQQREALGAEIASLQTSRQVLLQQATAYQESFRKIESEVVEKRAPEKLVESIQRYTPISALAEPKASARALPELTTTEGQQIYDFSLWLGLPGADKGRIRKVSYEFNHPTFRQKTMVSSNAEDGFKVGYRGWGCLNSVIITLVLRDVPAERIDFDMCRALGWR